MSKFDISKTPAGVKGTLTMDDGSTRYGAIVRVDPADSEGGACIVMATPGGWAYPLVEHAVGWEPDSASEQVTP